MFRNAEVLAAQIHRPPNVIERALIQREVEACGGKIDGNGNAAEQLGLHPDTLRSRMQKLGIARPARPA